MWRLTTYRLYINQLQTSPTPSLPRTNIQHACCTQYSMPSLHSLVNQCSVLSVCFACFCATPHHLHNANANRALHVHDCVVLCATHSTEMSVRLWTCGWWRSIARPRALQVQHGLYSHVALCILHFAGARCVDFHTLYDQPFRSQHWARFHIFALTSFSLFFSPSQISCFVDVELKYTRLRKTIVPFCSVICESAYNRGCARIRINAHMVPCAEVWCYIDHWRVS